MSELYLFDQCYRSDYGVVAGVDEAGRGPLAGPLVACAVVLPDNFDDETLNDSKKLTDKVRRRLKPVIEGKAVAVSLGVVTHSEIDANRMAWAVRTSFRRAMAPVLSKADVFLVDGNSVAGLEAPAKFVVKGDSKSISIAAASVVAKVARDDLMLEAHLKYPEYGFDRNKGYGTKEHIEILKKIGPSPIHRMSFAPLSTMYQTGQMSLFPMDVPNPGRAAENRAALYYENQGFTVLSRNWCCSRGEIDLVLQKDATVVFVEVKSTLSGRSREALQKIDLKKIARVRHAAEAWMAQSGFSGDCSLEAALVTVDSVVRIPVH